MLNKEHAEHYLVEMSKNLGAFFAACGYTQQEAMQNAKEVIHFIGQYQVKMEDDDDKHDAT